MPIMSFYAYRAVKHKRIAILTLTDWPTDWQHLKTLLGECAFKLYMEYHVTDVVMTLELHLPGKFTRKTEPGTYREIRVRYRREVEWTGRLQFNLKTTEVTVDQCSFGPHLWMFASDYYAERGVHYRSPPLIPKTLQKPGDPKALLMDPSGVRYADYSRQPVGGYDFRDKAQKKHRMYEPPCESIYLPENFQIREEEENS
jgi:hypothetical protein